MQESLTLSRPYASAAFQFASEKQDVQSWSEALLKLGVAVSDKQMVLLIKHPRVEEGDILDVLFTLLGEALDEPKQNFVRILLRAKRLELAPYVSELFEEARLRSNDTTEIDLVSAYPLTDRERETIAVTIRRRFGGSCDIRETVDNSLIGGIVLKIGDSVIDLSLTGRLSKLYRELI
jgi:F-type H+-transporting ATPase subunit delta